MIPGVAFEPLFRYFNSFAILGPLGGPTESQPDNRCMRVGLELVAESKAPPPPNSTEIG